MKCGKLRESGRGSLWDGTDLKTWADNSRYMYDEDGGRWMNGNMPLKALHRSWPRLFPTPLPTSFLPLPKPILSTLWSPSPWLHLGPEAWNIPFLTAVCQKVCLSFRAQLRWVLASLYQLSAVLLAPIPVYRLGNESQKLANLSRVTWLLPDQATAGTWFWNMSSWLASCSIVPPAL